MFGWSQAIQAMRRPSGDSAGWARKREPATTLTTADASSAALPSSGTRTRSRSTSVGPLPVKVSRIARTASPAGIRPPYRTAGSSGVSGTGSAPGASMRCSRRSAKSANTARSPTAVQAPPPYSCTRLRTFQGAATTGSGEPSAACRKSPVRRSAEIGSDHQISPPT